jgi:hypothetical protein
MLVLAAVFVGVMLLAIVVFSNSGRQTEASASAENMGLIHHATPSTPARSIYRQYSAEDYAPPPAPQPKIR